MAIRVGINGFGRIGRMAFRAIINDFGNLFKVVAVNDLMDPEYLAYMLKYDSVHSRLNHAVSVSEGNLIVDGEMVRLTAEQDPQCIAWGALDVDIVLDCTGLFLTEERCLSHLKSGAKKVIMSAPAKDETPMFVYGVNHHHYAGQQIVSAASCTTNCLAPVAKVLHDHWGIKRGLMSTIHAATATQKTVDGPSSKDWRGGRGILENIIPSSTGAAKAVGKVLPELEGKLTGMAFRVPTSNVSVIDLTVELIQPTDYQEVCAVMQAASVSPQLNAVLGYTDEKVVATDFRGCCYASVFDADAGMALDDTFMKIVAWYDNEYGYTCNMLRLASFINS